MTDESMTERQRLFCRSNHLCIGLQVRYFQTRRKIRDADMAQVCLVNSTDTDLNGVPLRPFFAAREMVQARKSWACDRAPVPDRVRGSPQVERTLNPVPIFECDPLVSS